MVSKLSKLILACIASAILFFSPVKPPVTETLGAPSVTYQRTLLPIDSNQDLGSTSNTWRGLYVSNCVGCGGGGNTTWEVISSLFISPTTSIGIAVGTSTPNFNAGKFTVDTSGTVNSSSSIKAATSITGLNFVANNFSSGIGYSAVATINGTIGYHYLVPNFGTWQLTSNAASLRELLSDQSFDMFQSGDGFSSVPWSFRIVQDGTHNKILLRLLQDAAAGGAAGSPSILNILAADSATNYLDVSASGTLVLASSTANPLGKLRLDQLGNINASGTLAVQINKFVVDSISGKVGIGTTTPIGQLTIGSREELQSGTIQNTFSSFPGILLNANAGGNQIQLWDNNGNEAKGGLIMTGGTLYVGVWDAGSSGIGTMIFRTANTDRMTVGSGGLLTANYGITVADQALTVASSTSGRFSVSTSGAVYMGGLQPNNAADYNLCWENNGLAAGEVTQSATGCTVSTKEAKHDFGTLSDPLLAVMEMKPASWKFNKDESTDIGFFAEDMQRIDPRLVVVENGKVKGLRPHQEIDAYLAGAIQEQQKEIEGLGGKPVSKPIPGWIGLFGLFGLLGLFKRKF